MNRITNNRWNNLNNNTQPTGLSDHAWGVIQQSTLQNEENGSIWRGKAGYEGFLNKFLPDDLPIVLETWGKKFQHIVLDSYPNQLPALDFSQCTYATDISLKDLNYLPAITGNLEDHHRLVSVTVENVRSVERHALDGLSTIWEVTIWCENSGLFRIGGQQGRGIDFNEVAAFLHQHPNAHIYGLIPDNTIPPQNFLDSLAQHGMRFDRDWETPTLQ